MGQFPLLEVKVWAPYACFTRPEMKVERVTYPVMTPSAARGVLEAIFWKPEFQWQVREIWVLKPIRHISLLRNEVSQIISEQSVAPGKNYFIDDDRAQRHTLALRDVEYLIRADVRLRSHAEHNEAAYRDQFRRRVQRGQCYHRPYLGCREFSAQFALPTGDEQPIETSDDLGLVLGEIIHEEKENVLCRPVYFHALLRRGVLQVPPEIYLEVV